MSGGGFSELLVNNSASLKPFAVSLTQDQEAAKDLFQETLYRALVNRDRYYTGTNVKAWLFTIMKNIFINDYRRRRKRRIIFDDYSCNLSIDPGNVTVCNNGVESLQIREIQNLIHQLPHIFRTPFLLYFEGYSYHEISASLKEPMGTIKSRIHFARKLLKEQLNSY